jgi:prepilin peptidase CpaA
MGWVNLPLVLILVLGGLLVAAGIEDARRREIANAKNAAIALLAPLAWWANGLSPWPDMAVQCGLAALVFLIFVGVFAAGWMGGGDVKLIGALALWLPPEALATMLVVMSIAGGVVTLAMLVDHRLRRRGSATPIEVPYGVAIAAAGLISLNEPILNHLAR